MKAIKFVINSTKSAMLGHGKNLLHNYLIQGLHWPEMNIKSQSGVAKINFF